MCPLVSAQGVVPSERTLAYITTEGSVTRV